MLPHRSGAPVNVTRRNLPANSTFERTVRETLATLRENHADTSDPDLVPSAVSAWLLVEAFGLEHQPHAAELTAALAERALSDRTTSPRRQPSSG